MRSERCRVADEPIPIQTPADLTLKRRFQEIIETADNSVNEQYRSMTGGR
jgi:hypothetical protein